MGVHEGRLESEEGLHSSKGNGVIIVRSIDVMSTVRKELVWSIKKNLYQLSCDDVYKLAKDIASDSSQDLESTDEGSCVDYIFNYMQSDTLLKSEDEGMSELLMLNDLVKSITLTHVTTHYMWTKRKWFPYSTCLICNGGNLRSMGDRLGTKALTSHITVSANKSTKETERASQRRRSSEEC